MAMSDAAKAKAPNPRAFGSAIALVVASPMVYVLGSSLLREKPSFYDEFVGAWSSADGRVTVRFNRFGMCKVEGLEGKEVMGPVDWDEATEADGVMKVGFTPLDTVQISIKPLFEAVGEQDSAAAGEEIEVYLDSLLVDGHRLRPQQQ